MRRFAVFALVAVSSPSAGVAVADGVRVPVVVELYSSEGCSSCPPADVLLARLDRDQPIAGVEIIALEMHVDYWNQLGWTDPFSQSALSSRQRMHDGALGTGTYTPQIVVDGRFDALGSSATSASIAIQQAARLPHVAVQISRSGDSIAIQTAAAPPSEGAARVMLATTERGLRTNVTAGENRGETLVHGPVVRTLRSLGDVGGTGFNARVQVPARPSTRVVVFVEARDSLHILGAAAVD
jgi:hypothetical protein